METVLFRNLCVNLQNALCDVALFMPIGYHASAEFLDFDSALGLALRAA